MFEMNRSERRTDQLATYLDIYLAFQIPKPTNNTFKIQILSSHLITGYEAIGVASNTFFKYTLNDTSASIQTQLIYREIENMTLKLNLGSLFSMVSVTSCYVKVIPISLMIDV